MNKTLAGQRVLVLEDDFLQASNLATVLEEAGATVVGPCNNVAAARARIAEATCATLDVKLRGGSSLAFAQELKNHLLPYIFITGYDATMIPSELADVIRLRKPFAEREAVAAICSAGSRPANVTSEGDVY